ncbi:MAG: glycosyltransferase [Clostridia bacterium]|nr:glycosyltransferase [Clostridia bacterium]
MQISVIIPMYNETSIIAETAKALSDYMTLNFETYEILFSDDGSIDGCGDVVRNLALPFVRVTGYQKNQGKGCAVRTAMLEAKGDFVMFTDADLAYGTDVIRRAYDLWEKNGRPNLLIGSRNLGKDGYEGYTWVRKIMSKVYIKVLCLVGGFKLSDSQCGCKGFDQRASKEIFRRCKVNGFAFDFEAILWADQLGFRITEMPVKIINHRESKIHIFRDTFRMLRDLRTIRKDVKKTAKAEK